ncbi:MAG: transcriptional repressor LexA [Sphingomonadaceae bacterium]|uniref:transcriptional repressor LexA n=1 Tax=Thermaurantiacus sp. TaxID=2820283 RepID=UPI00298ED4F9|nr:transcriptional repressor LexA [Thermaurantiacus sp.]MCS6986524.1 transcriptional repressor LexA [Sphingomonadaceae bacterium]MDW8414215.1 transcriptional repressor LexA [Thermaurantiacus sp.]
MLTAKQRALLLFIDRRLREVGVPPSFEEMREALGLRSKSGVHRLVEALVERGFLRRLPHRARALEVLRRPGEPAGMASPAEVVSLGARRARGGVRAARAVVVPFVGRIAAGRPLEAVEDRETLEVPAFLLGPGEHFALQVVGDSMVEAGILDGDFALVRRTEEARPGDIVVALIDGCETTLKYFHRERGMIRLDPANPAYAPQLYLPSRVRIQGRLAGLLRRY